MLNRSKKSGIAQGIAGIALMTGLVAQGILVPASNAGAATTQQSRLAHSITACVSQFSARTRPFLTLKEAKMCAAGARVFSPASLRATRPSASLFIVDNHGHATINLVSSTNLGRSSRVRSHSCYNSYSSGSVNWWGGDNGGSINATGYGNHCGYSRITGYTLSKWCVCTGMSYSSGSYDSNYGKYAYNSPYAAVWANGELSTSFVQWQNFIRLYLNSNGGWWNYIQLG